MITEEFIKQRFIHDTVSEGINTIYQTQEKVVRAYLETRSGNLLAHLQRRPFTSQEVDAGRIFYMRVFPYLRFLDIAYRKGNDRMSRHIRKNLALYNRVIWGVLYHETFPQLRYGFTDEIRNSIRQDIQSAIQNEKTA